MTYTGARPCFIDSRDDGNVDPELLDEAIRDQRVKGNRVSAVMSVDLLGRVADYDAIGEVCSAHDVPLIEDAAEALGSSYQGAPAGSFGEAAVLSFNGNKIMTTSGGGMLLTDDESLASHARFLSTQAREPVPHYEHRHIGYNYRLSNVLAALGRAQLSRLDGMIARRREIRSAYTEAIAELEGVTIFQGEGANGDNHWLTALLLDPQAARMKPFDLMAELDARGIEARPLWKPMHQQPIFSDAAAYTQGVADRLFQSGVTLPSGSLHGTDAIDRVCSSLHDLLGAT